MTTRTGRPSGDPRTVVGLIYRIIDEPHRTACTVAILVLPLCAVAQVLGHGSLFGVPVTWIGTAASASGTGVMVWLRRRARNRAKAAPDDERGCRWSASTPDPLVPDDVTAAHKESVDRRPREVVRVQCSPPIDSR